MSTSRLFLIRLEARRDGRPSKFAVEVDFSEDGQRFTLLRVADVEHELTTEETRFLTSERGLEKAILAAEWERRKPAALKDERKRRGPYRSGGQMDEIEG